VSRSINASDLRRAAIVTAGVAAALASTALAWPYLAPVPYLLLVAAVVAASRWGSRSSGLFALGLATVGAAFVVPQTTPPVGLIVFVAVGAFLNHLTSGRQGVEAALRASEAELRASWEHSAMGTAVLDRNGLVERLNPAFESTLGYAGSAWTGVAFNYFVHPDDEGAERARFSALMNGVEVSYQHEQRYRRSDGTIIWGRATVSALRDGARTTGALMMIEDVTARRLAEEGLRASEERLRRLFEGLPVGLFQSTPTGKMLAVNPALAQMLGYPSVETLQALNVRDLFADASAYASLRTALEVSHEVSNHHAVLRRHGGDHLTVRISARTARHPSGVTWYDEVSVLDVTERLALEAELLQTQKRETLGRLVGGLAHDFNNLLTAIGGWTEIALRQLGPDAPREDLEEVLKAGRRASALTRQLLVFSRREHVDPEAIDLNEVVRSVSRQLQEQCGDQVKVLPDLAPDLLPIAADPNHIEQILIQLAANGRDAMPRGGRLMIETANVTLDTRYGFAKPARPEPGKYVLLAVTDAGLGMDDHVKAHLFEPFFSTKPGGQGAGLGLATVYSIAKRLNGYVWVYSELDRGTTVKVYFPTVVAPEAPHAAEESTGLADAGAAVPAGAGRVLIVEDDEGVRGVARTVLRGRGYDVIEARSAEEGRRQAAAHAIDLLLTDVVLPGIDGPALAAELRAIQPGLKVLFTSGYTHRVMVSRGVLPPGAEFLEKPFTGSLLVQKVQAALGGAPAGDPSPR